MKALALVALALALEAGFLFTLALPAHDLASAREARLARPARVVMARVVMAGSPAAAPAPAPHRW